MEARYPGMCGKCRATVSVGDWIEYDGKSRKITKCLMCGAKRPRDFSAKGPHAWKADPGMDAGTDRRHRCLGLAQAELTVLRTEHEIAVTTDPRRRAALLGRLPARQQAVQEQRDELKGIRYTPADVAAARSQIIMTRIRELRHELKDAEFMEPEDLARAKAELVFYTGLPRE